MRTSPVPRIDHPRHFLATIATAILILCAAPLGQSQTFTVVHSFTGGSDGATPYAGLTIDAEGNLYGTANAGGLRINSGDNCNGYGCGTVFELKPSGVSFDFSVIHSFVNSVPATHDGEGPYGRVIFGPDGSLYGTTISGGNSSCLGGCGTVYKLTPPNWTETIIHRFAGPPDGSNPIGDVTFDRAGNLYGTTFVGGTGGPGIVYELSLSGGEWTENILHAFSGVYRKDGGNPDSGVFLSGGNIYGTTSAGGKFSNGAVYELRPGGHESMIHSFNYLDGAAPYGGLMTDGAGNLYGTAAFFGPNSAGTFFRLVRSRDRWSFEVLYDFPAFGGLGPWAQLVMDAEGNFYGTTQGATPDYGTVFKLSQSNGIWTETILHTFTGRGDGAFPYSSLAFDQSGNIYGTASAGGEHGFGVVFEISPN